MGKRKNDEKKTKNTRTLDMYVRLCEGKIIYKAEEALRFGVDERSIQRDIDDIRAFLDNRSAICTSDSRTVVYDRGKKGFVMTGQEASMMTNSEILAVSKILLESRAFTKKEISSILDKLIAGCVPQKNMKLVSDLIANEKYHYVELRHRSSVKDILWVLGQDIKQCELIELTYQKQVNGKEIIKRTVEPVALMFSEYYFYLHAYIVEKKGAEYQHLYDFPAIFRLDRILKCKELGIKYKVAYADRFEEGEFRKRIQFMFSGKLQKVQFKYSGNSVDAILDRIPSARILSEEKNDYLIEAEIYGKGIIMWLLSQSTAVEIIKPTELREEMKSILQKILEKYS